MVSKQLSRIVVYADDMVLTLGAAAIVSEAAQFEALIAGTTLFDLIPFLEKIRPDAVLLHLSAEMTVGFLSTLRNTLPSVKVVLWGKSFSEELTFQAREAGVAGFIHRGITPECFVAALTGIVEGGLSPSAQQAPERSTTVKLTGRESQLVSLLAQGLKNKEIASCLSITEGTVRIYLSKLFAKIGARDRFETAVFGLKNAYLGQASWDGKNGFVTENDEERARPVLKSLVLVEPQRRRGYTRRPAVVNEAVVGE